MRHVETPEPPARCIAQSLQTPPCNSLQAGEHGQALVESAVALPILLVILTGILTFGIAINNYLTLTNATNSGARQLAISRLQTTDPCATAVSAVYSASPGLRQASMSFSFVIDGTPYSGVSCSSSSYTTGAAGNLVQQAAAQVTVTYPCALAVFGINYAPGCTLQAQTTELVQ